jgi:hypothetical protein
MLHPGHWLFLAHQMAKEASAAINVASDAKNIAAGVRL